MDIHERHRHAPALAVCSSWPGWRSASAPTWPRPRLSSLRRNH